MYQQLYEIYGQITPDEYKKSLPEITEEIRRHQPFVFFQNDPMDFSKTVAIKLVARHIQQNDKDVLAFIRRHEKQILPFLTANPHCPPQWTEEEILSYATIVLGVQNIYNALENI